VLGPPPGALVEPGPEVVGPEVVPGPAGIVLGSSAAPLPPAAAVHDAAVQSARTPRKPACPAAKERRVILSDVVMSPDT
jgi:hypothetical protein